MKKTILFLINGFGMENQGSYNIYNKELMPNLDSYTQKYLFGTIETSAFTTEQGYRLFSTSAKQPLTYDLLNKFEDKFDTNPNLVKYLETIQSDSTIHLYCPLENDKAFEHMRKFLKFIKSKKENPIIIHIFLTEKDNKKFNETERLASKINYELKEYKLGTVVGKNILNSTDVNEYMALLHNKIGEKWKEINKKFNSLAVSGIAPENTKGFFVEENFEIKQNDSVFFMNYENEDFTYFVEAMKKTYQMNNFYSMFPIIGINYPMFGYPISGVSMEANLSTIHANACVVASKEDITKINYFATGLKNELPKNIAYTLDDIIEDKQALEALFKDNRFSFYIINTSIDSCKNVNEVIEKLKQIDASLGLVHDICEENKYTLFISSLFGIKKELIKDNFTRCQIDFSERVPVVVIDDVYQKGTFHLDIGNVYNLANTCFKNMDLKYDGEVIIKKNSSLSKMIKK